MNIAIVWKNDYPWDIRVEKMAAALADAGYEVCIIARNLRSAATTEMSRPGVTIRRMRPWRLELLNKTFSLPAFFNPFWYLHILRVCGQVPVDVLIVRDLPLVLTSAAVARRYRIPLVFDMAENYPALWMEVSKGKGATKANRILKNPRFARWIERLSFKCSDHIITVVEEARDHVFQAGVEPSTISIVSNTPDLEKCQTSHAQEKPASWAGRRVMLYQGYVNRARGLAVAVRAMARLRDEFPDLLLVIVGTGDDVAALQRMVEDFHLGGAVAFSGWIPHSEIFSMIEACNIGLITHLATEHKNTTVPNKLFDYMAFSKPVVVSSARPLRRIVEEERCGLVFESGNSDDFAEAAARLLRDPLGAQEMGRRGRHAVEQKYNWGRDAAVLVETIAKIAARRELTGRR